jgi:hypothetical protein
MRNHRRPSLRDGMPSSHGIRGSLGVEVKVVLVQVGCSGVGWACAGQQQDFARIGGVKRAVAAAWHLRQCGEAALTERRLHGAFPLSTRPNKKGLAESATQ